MDRIAMKLRKDESNELSNEEIITLLKLGLQFIRQREDVFERFDVILSERVQGGGFKSEEFAKLMETIAGYN